MPRPPLLALSSRVNNLWLNLNGPCKRYTSSVTRKPFTVIVEGNIGCGKTTFLDFFKENNEIHIYDEPVKQWRDLKGYNLLRMMYEDPMKWSLTFQTFVQYTMVYIHNQIPKTPVKMMERSIFSARYCFVENLFRSGKMPHPDYIVLEQWFNWFINNTNCHVDLIVYMRAEPDVLKKRILERGRPEEQAISLDLLTTLHKLHEDWLLEKRFPVPAPVIVLDVNCEKKFLRGLYDQTQQHIAKCRGQSLK